MREDLGAVLRANIALYGRAHGSLGLGVARRRCRGATHAANNGSHRPLHPSAATARRIDAPLRGTPGLRAQNSLRAQGLCSPAVSAHVGLTVFRAIRRRERRSSHGRRMTVQALT